LEYASDLDQRTGKPPGGHSLRLKRLPTWAVTAKVYNIADATQRIGKADVG
jgi:hypothetical protein